MDWVERQVDESAVASLVAAGESPLFARLLALRGVTDQTRELFRSPKWSDIPEPDELPGIAEAANAVLAMLKSGRKIVIFGDYDCDGLCATAILTLVLRRLSEVLGVEADVAAFIPERLTEGYGLSDASVARMMDAHPDVAMLLTVDNGVNAVEQIAALKSQGIAVVVTDHHLPGETLPVADALVDPKVAAPPHLGELCGAMVAYFLARSLFRIVRSETGRDDVAGGMNGALLEMASLATVTDIMPLAGINRTLVFNALREFHTRAPLGLRTLYQNATRKVTQTLTAKDFGCLLGPRINAVGRLGAGSQALDLLLCLDDEKEKAQRLAEEIEKLNEDRRFIEQRMTLTAFERCTRDGGAQVISFSSEADRGNVHSGVAGIVASRLMERLRPAVPVCVLVDGKGSARAPQGYNIRDALVACSEYLTSYGGHAAAAGLSVKQGCLDAFREAFRAACSEQARIGEESTAGALPYDAAVAVADVTDEFVNSVEELSPFGEGNPEPVFMLRGLWIDLAGLRRRGMEGQHLQVAFRAKSLPRTVWRNHGDFDEKIRIRGEAAYDILFTPRMVEADYGDAYPVMNIVAMRPAQ